MFAARSDALQSMQPTSPPDALAQPVTIDYTLRAEVPTEGAFFCRVFELTSRGLVEASSRRWAESRMREKCSADAHDPHTRIVQVGGNDCGVFTVESRAAEHWLHSDAGGV